MKDYITYYFDRYGEEDFEYEFDDNDAVDYIERTHSADEIILDFVNSNLFNTYTEEARKEIANDYGFDDSTRCIKTMSDDDKKEFIKDLYITQILIEETDIYKDELADYFQDDAYAAWKESKLDDYQQRGISPRDFI